jgi:hypothetical protein
VILIKDRLNDNRRQKKKKKKKQIPESFLGLSHCKSLSVLYLFVLIGRLSRKQTMKGISVQLPIVTKKNSRKQKKTI